MTIRFLAALRAPVLVPLLISLGAVPAFAGAQPLPSASPALPTPALRAIAADSAGPQVADPKAGEKSPRARLPRDRRTQLDAMFEALRLAPDDESASALGTRLDDMFSQSPSPSTDLLMGRAALAAGAKQYDLAVELLNTVVEIEPDNIGARMRRATIFYAQDDYANALVDLGEVMTREPRHYTALLGFALIMREMGDDRRALDAARRALAINPHLTPAKDIESELKAEVDGQAI